MTQILVFGDSIAYGAWDIEGGWVSRLRKYLDKKTLSDPEAYYIIYNLGVSGDTAEDLLARFDFESKSRFHEDKEEEVITIISIGGNDAVFLNKESKLLFTPEEFSNNLQKVIDKAKDISKSIVLIGITPVDEEIVDPIPWAPEMSYKEENIKNFNEIVKAKSAENDILFVGLDDIFSGRLKDLFEDGCHPNTEGHKLIYEKIRKTMEENKLI